MAGRCVVQVKSLRRGDFCGVLDRDCCGGLRWGLLCFDVVAAIRVGDLNLALPSAELARADCVELPESDVALIRRVLIGIRDCEFRFDVLAELEVEGGSRGGERLVPYTLNVGGPEGPLVKSLLVRRCMFRGNSGIAFSVLISSKVGVAPRYQAVGDEGDISGRPRS